MLQISLHLDSSPKQMDRQTLRLKQCLDWINKSSVVPNAACRQKSILAQRRAKKCCKNHCVLIPPPHGFLMDRQMDRQTSRLKYLLKQICEHSEESNSPSRQKNLHPSSKESKNCCKNNCVLIPPPHGFLMTFLGCAAILAAAQPLKIVFFLCPFCLYFGCCWPFHVLQEVF